MINAKWLKNTTIKKTKTTKNSFSILQDKVDIQLKNIIRDIVTKKNPNKHELNVKAIYESTFHSHNSKTEAYFHNKYFELKKIFSQDDMLLVWKWCIEENMILPFHYGITIDDLSKKHEKIISFGDGNTLIHDQDDYKSKSKLKEEKFISFLNNIIECVLGENHNINVKNVVKLDKMISSAMMSRVKYRDPHNSKKTITDKKKMKSLRIDKLLHVLGYNKIPDKVVVYNEECFFKLLTHFEKRENKESWFDYLITSFIIRISSYHDVWYKYYFDYYNSYSMGQDSMITKPQTAANRIVHMMNTCISKKYLQQHENRVNINYAKNLTNEYINAFRNRIEKNCWLSHITKMKAIEKLNNIRVYIGHKDRFEDDFDGMYSNECMCTNSSLFHKWSIKRDMKMIGKIYDPQLWDPIVGVNVFSVNAYYMPHTNEIVLPNAILQKPFLDANRSYVYNIASLGCTIGHEIVHAFDDEGHHYDKDGILNNWWNKEEENAYKRKTNTLASVYEKYINKKQFDIQLSMGENIADIGGLLVSEDLILEHLQKKGKYDEQKTKTLVSFYSYYVRLWKSKTNPIARKYLFVKDEHLAPKIRADVSLMQMQNFQHIYQLPKNHIMFQDNHIDIW
jgi:putative endopeptidase